MIRSERLRPWLYSVLLAVPIGTCEMKKEESGKDKQVKENLNKTLSLCSTKNPEDFYNKEDLRDQESEKGNKDAWIIHSKMIMETNGKNMESRGLVLYVDRSTRTIKGEFIMRGLWGSKKGYSRSKRKEYPVKMEHNKTILTKPIADDKLRKEIENFKFSVQYGDFKGINDYKSGDIPYNPNVPSYLARYQLSNDDHNVKQLRKGYGIPTKKAPKLLMRGGGDLKGLSIGCENLEFTLVENKEKNIYFTDSISFKPTE